MRKTWKEMEGKREMFRQNLSYSGLRRMVAGLFIVIFISVNTGNFLLYAFFSSALITEVKAGSLRTLTKVKNATELVYYDILAFLIQMGHGNITMTRLMFEKERDRILEYQAYQIMQSAAVSYPYITYIAVYNERLDKIIGTNYFDPSTEAEFKSLAHYFFQQGTQNLTIPLAVRYLSSGPEAAAKNTITMLIYSPLSLAGDKGVLLAGINCDYFQQLIQRLDDGGLETVMILHGNGQVISHPDPGRQLLSYRDREYLEDLYSSPGDSGFYMKKIDRAGTYISYTKSDVLNWTFVSMIPYKNMASKLIFLRNLTFILTFCILCTGLFISYLMALRMYGPVQRILKRLDYEPAPNRPLKAANENEYIEKQIDYLRSAADISEPLIRNTIVLDLLKNQYIDSAVINEKITGTIFKEPYYMVCILSFNEKDRLEKLSAEEQGAERNKLIKIAGELFREACASADYAALSSTDTAVVLHLETGAVPENLVPLLMEISEMTKKFCGWSVSASAGSIVNSIFAINDSFEEAEEFLKERLFSGPSLPPLVQDAVKLAAEKYGDPLFSINTAAEFFNITPAYFNRLFKKYKHISYSEFLNEYRMERACRLLRETNQSVIDVSASVGISNTTYFYTLFKKIYNLTPQQFRNKREKDLSSSPPKKNTNQAEPGTKLR